MSGRRNALACMLIAQAFANALPHGFGTPGVSAGECTEALPGGLLQLLLARSVLLIAIAFIQPFLRGPIEGP